MKRGLAACLAVATVAVVSAASIDDAAAQYRRYHRGYGYSGGAVAAGIIGGVAAGAIIAGAAAAPYGYPVVYRPVPGYVAYDGYYAAAPYGCPGGYWARRPVRDQWGNVIGWSRPRYFCR